MEIPTHSLIGTQLGEGKDPVGHGHDPVRGQELEPTFFSATEAELNLAAELAATAFPAYAAIPTSERAEFLNAVAAALEQRSEAIVARYQLETGLPKARANSELARTCLQLRLYGAHGASDAFRAEEQVAASPDAPALCSHRVPLGPVLVFGASNFPLAYSTAGGDVASALAAGCPVIAFAHSAHPGVAGLVGETVIQVVQERGLPEGTFSLIYGRGSQQGDFLARHPAIKAIGFTGSRAAGDAIQKATQARAVPIPVYAEMSSVNPVVFGPQALAQRAEELASTVFESVTTGAGQFCTCPGLLLVPRGSEGDEFVEILAKMFLKAPAQVMLNSGIASDYTEGRERLDKRPGVRLIAEGGDPDELAKASGQAALYETDEEAFLADIEAQAEEVFGPSTLLVRLTSLPAAANLLDALGGQLAISFFLQPAELPVAGEAIAAAERSAGRIVFDGMPTGVRVCAAQVHGGPYPATFDGSTSVGEHALDRWVRRLAWQNAPVELGMDD